MNRNNIRLFEEKKEDIRIEIVELCFVVLDDNLGKEIFID